MVAAAAAAGLLALAPGAAGSRSSAGGWLDKGMHVVGGPVSSGGRLLVLAAGSRRQVSLEAIDPANGKVAWRRPEVFSRVTQLAGLSPDVLGDVALAMLPVPSAPRSERTELAGIDVATGKQLWRTGPLFVDDVPTACPPPLLFEAFCVITGSERAPALVAIHATSGRQQAVAKGIGRSILARAGLYEPVTRPATLVGVEAPGGVRWKRTFARLFGSGRFDPSDGWDVADYGSEVVITVGSPLNGGALHLDQAKTIALDPQTGKVLWRRAGAFRCFGQLFVQGPFLCEGTGTVSSGNGATLKVSKGATLTLEGFSPTTGQITWRVRVDDIAELAAGVPRFVDETDMIVTVHGKRRVLDVTTGLTSPIPTGTVAWCARDNSFPTAGEQQSYRVGTNLFAACTVTGRPASTAPPTGVVGISIGNVFVWPDPSGLKAVPSGGALSI
jgi:outer membrane protein assembly factor BamB